MCEDCSTLSDTFVGIRQKKNEIKRILLDQNDCVQNIRTIIDSRCLKILGINGSSVVFKANKRLRDYNEDEFNDYIYNFIQQFCDMYRIKLDVNEIFTISDIYRYDDAKVIINF